MDDVAENRDNIALNTDNIAENTENLQEYFKDTMNFDAITLIENAYLEGPPVIPLLEGALMVNINGNEGYACGTVDQHTADLLCQKAGYAGATNSYTQGER